MGPETKEPRNIQIFLDGKPVGTLAILDGIGTLTVTDTEAEPAIIGAFGPVAFAARISIPKRWRCRSRKRFIKLLMASGCPRNDAAEIARIPPRAAWRGLSFQTLYFHTMALLAAEADTQD